MFRVEGLGFRVQGSGFRVKGVQVRQPPEDSERVRLAPSVFGVDCSGLRA